MKGILVISIKIFKAPVDPAMPILDISPKDVLAHILKETHIRIFNILIFLSKRLE